MRGFVHRNFAVLLAGVMVLGIGGLALAENFDQTHRTMKGGANVLGLFSAADAGFLGNVQFNGDAGFRGQALFIGDAGFNSQVTMKAMQVGSGGAVATRILQATATVDFVTATTTCTESGAITITGALAGDACFPIVPSSVGSTNASYTCYVSASDACKVRHCAAGSADDPASATFGCVVFSIQ
jgi:hypothetical protein